MQTLRKSADRGHANHGWLDSYHSFSFADYHDPEHMGHGPLRVINEDRIQPGTGFPTHGHRDMEIISYVLDGVLTHEDSMGNGSAIVPGDVQRMSAGTGVRHSEFNHSKTGVTHLLQIWIQPKSTGVEPSYEQTHFPVDEKRGRLRLVASPDGRDCSVSMNQDACLYAGLFDGDEAAGLMISPGRRAYVHLARGSISVNGQRLHAGDAMTTGPGPVVIEAGTAAEVLVFDLP